MGPGQEPGRGDDVEAAVEKALGILEAAAQTRFGLKRKLRRAGYDPGTADAACDRVEGLGYVSDRAYAEAVLRRRRQQGRGRRVIAAELSQKGIDNELIDGVLAQISVDDEIEAAAELAQKLLRRYAGQPRQLARVTAALLRRGYANTIARKALEQASE